MNSNYGWWLPVAASSYAGRIDGSLAILHWAMVIIFGLWAVYMAYCLIRYRSSASPRADYHFTESMKALTPDVVILVFEVWLIFFVGVPIWAHIREDLPKPPEAVTVGVTAEQFAWTAHYPGADGQFGKQDIRLVNAGNPLGLDPADTAGQDDVVSVNTLVLPVGKRVLINLSAKDVIHSFFVPEFRIKQDAVPGMRIKLWVEPTLEGKFELGCAQLCGTGHYRMRADVLVKSAEEYQKWLDAQKKGI
ncbi:MAG: cytochrome c oxidase subunit II [Elusimicrobia bacterium RIFCSPLOWO2_01_FULL_60_11]|nr:MAG: cytochrome c oxidase subunit II [Elusimicrobia bacterium RIFCSPLOWO2_01_FULL_60_11]